MKSNGKGDFYFSRGRLDFFFCSVFAFLFALTKGIGAPHPHTSFQRSGENAAAAFSAAALREKVGRGGGQK